jgi:hypothetical protein
VRSTVPKKNENECKSESGQDHPIKKDINTSIEDEGLSALVTRRVRPQNLDTDEPIVTVSMVRHTVDAVLRVNMIMLNQRGSGVKTVVLGRKRNIIKVGRTQMVKVKGQLIKLSDARKEEKLRKAQRF